VSLLSTQSGSQEYRSRFVLAFTVVFIIFVLMFCRLFYLQIIQGDYFAETAQKNSIRMRRALAPRGVMYDRNGVVLVESRPSFNLMLIPHEIKDEARTLRVIAELLGREEAELEASLKRGRARYGNRAFPLVADMSRDELAKVESARLVLPGVVVDVQPIRHYPLGGFAAHLIGYLSEINERELKKRDFAGYRLGDFIGKYGVEKTYERFLRGRDGGKNVEVDVRGRELRVLNEIESTPGNDLVLTIDHRVQAAAEEALQVKEGAVVALDPGSGEVLAMVSRPAFKPADFASGVSAAIWRALTSDGYHPLNNRAIQGTYAPGSTYKLFTASAGIESGAINPRTILNCPGYYTLGNHTYRCWKKGGHGSVNLHKAIVQSCDTYFYKVGVKVGVNKLAFFSRSYGLGSRTGIALSGEKGGLIPTAEWKLKRFGHKWMLGETPSIAIGQGYDLLTPLQLALAYGSLGNGGTVYEPRILRKVTDAEGRLIEETKPIARSNLAVSDEHIQILQKALEGVVNEPGGTGRRSRLPGIRVAGKTGTAQVARDSVVRAMGRVPYKYRDNAWFVAYAPAKDPEIVVAVVAEHSGHGGSAAAPIARKVLAAHFGIEEEPEKPKIPRLAVHELEAGRD
jgi:penicillin-binding protein 2